MRSQPASHMNGQQQGFLTMLLGLRKNGAAVVQHVDALLELLGAPVIDGEIRELSPPPAQLPAPTRQKRIGALRRPAKQRRLPLAPGTLSQRIVEIIQEVGAPVKKVAIVPQSGANESSVTTALKALVESGHVIAIGATTARRYALPGMQE